MILDKSKQSRRLQVREALKPKKVRLIDSLSLSANLKATSQKLSSMKQTRMSL